jgi:hypothetical protein
MLRRSMIAAVAVGLLVSGCDYIPSSWLQKLTGVKTTVTSGTISNNSFNGTVQAEFVLPAKADDNFRDMKTLNAFSYKDPRGVVWEVPAGYITNGASVPWGLWNIVGGPYDGPYRDAAVIHDYYTEYKLRSWEDTHRMYYEASIARGVSENRASIMYAGLLVGADRWDVPAGAAATPKKAQMIPDSFKLAQVPPPATNKPIAPGATPTQTQQQIFNDMKSWIEKEKPSPDQIAKRVDEMRKAAGMPTKTR